MPLPSKKCQVKEHIQRVTKGIIWGHQGAPLGKQQEVHFCWVKSELESERGQKVRLGREVGGVRYYVTATECF